MEKINTTENLRLWLRSCPAVDRNLRFDVDFMTDDPVQYALWQSPSALTYKTDILGHVYLADIQELNYIFQALFHHSKDVAQNLDNLGFFTEFMNWINRQNVERSFPEIEEGAVLSITPALSPYVYDADSDTGRYQIQLRMRYRRK